MKSNVSTGFKWSATSSVDGLFDVQLIQLPGQPTDRFGAWGYTLIQLTGLNKGTAELQLEYARPFESAVDRKSKRLTLSVQVDV